MSNSDESSRSDPSKTAPGPAPALVSGGDLPPGYVVGEYRVEHILGRGGMGVVYAGVQPLIEKRVAIKVLNSDLSSDPALVKRFLDEARAVNRIRHPNIIDIFSFGQLADSRQYFVMEYLEGRTLAGRLQAGDLPLGECPPLLGQVCDALDAAHGESIVHRDLKPENIWIVEPRRGRPFVKLLDFGIAKLMSGAEPSTTKTGILMGTPQYMSPEQCHGRAIDARTDIYAMGVILYQVYTGRLPFRGDSFVEVITKQLTQTPERPSLHAPLPATLDDLIMRCLAKEPGDRPQSARQLGEALSNIFAAKAPPEPTALLVATAGKQTTTTLGGSAHGIERVTRDPAATRRWPWLLALVPAGIAAALVATWMAPSKGRSDREAEALVEAPPPQLAGELTVRRDAAVETAPIAKVPPTPRPSRGEQPAARSQPVARSQAPSPTTVHVPRSRPAARATKTPSRGHASSGGLVTDNPFR